jgi:hypothetical protein
MTSAAKKTKHERKNIMAKNEKAAVKKLELVPGTATELELFSPAGNIAIPKGAKKLTLPPMVKPEQVPVGSVISGVIVALANSISGRADMRESKLIHLRHESGSEFLFPLTGTIKKAVGGNEGVEANIGKTLIIHRNADSTTEKYGGVKKVFMFDVYLAD